jgi:capsular exopolysaccharide synthesis family protein
VDPIEYIRAIRRRWFLVVGAIALALTIAWVTSSVAPVGIGPPVRSYEATTVLLQTGGVAGLGGGNLKTVASITTIPDISRRVAEEIDYTGGDPAALGSFVSAFAEEDSGLLKISAQDTDPEFARTLSDTFAKQLLAFLRDRVERTNQAELSSLNKSIDKLRNEIRTLDGRIARAGTGTEFELLTAQRNAKIQTSALLINQQQQLAANAGESVGLLILQDAVPVLVPTPSSFQPPRSRNSRLILGALVGLLGGVALSLVLERFDTRIRTKRAAEKHFGLPVLAEIPFISKRKRRRLSSVVPWRKSREDVPVITPYFPRVSDSFRLLAAGISRTAVLRRAHAGGPFAGRPGSGNGPGAVILVTSPGPSEGKTTVVANLAMTFAQVGKKVLVMSCDFRRPHIHDLFGLGNSVGLVEALQSENSEAPVLDGHIEQTPIRDVRLVPSGAHPRNTAALLSSDRMRTALEEARQQADIVLIDTAPLLASAEVSHLFQLVDAVVIVARAKRTTAEIAERASELLKRLDAPVVGVALNGAVEVPVPSSYYRYYTQPMREPPPRNGTRRAESEPNGQRRRRAEEEQGRVGDSPL